MDDLLIKANVICPKFGRVDSELGFPPSRNSYNDDFTRVIHPSILVDEEEGIGIRNIDEVIPLGFSTTIEEATIYTISIHVSISQVAAYMCQLWTVLALSNLSSGSH